MIVQILNIQINTLIALLTFNFLLFVFVFQLGSAFTFLLSTTNGQLVFNAVNFGVVHLFDGLFGIFGVLEGNKAESLGFALGIGHYGTTQDFAEFRKQIFQLFFVQIIAEVFHENVCVAQNVVSDVAKTGIAW